jgi:Uma2 family endonuclease
MVMVIVMGEVIERHRFTAQQYDKMIALGIIDSETRVELIDGEIIAMSPANEPHEGMVRLILNRLMPLVGQLATVDVQNAVALNDRSRPEPDLMLLKPRYDAYRNHRPRPQDVLLLIEVADSSLQKDRTVKLPNYARAGIPEVWIIDLEGRCVEIYRNPVKESYGQVLVLQQGHIVCLALPQIALLVDDLFA